MSDPEAVTRDAATPKISLVRNVSWLGFANIAVKPFWFVFVTALSMRLMGVEQYGVMNAALSLCLIATSFTDLGMTRYSVREISRDRSRASLYFSNFLTLRVGNVFLGWLGALLGAWVLGYRGDAVLAVVFAGVYVFSLELTNYCRAIYQAFETLRSEAVMLVVEKALVIGFGLLLLLETRTAHWTLAGMAAGMVLTTAINTGFISRHLATLRIRSFDLGFLKRSLKLMIPFGLAGFFANIYFRVDMVMIEAMLGVTPTGQYGAAFRILEALNMLPTVVAIAAVYPRLARLREQGLRGEFSSLMRRSMWGLVGASLLIAGALTAAAPWVIHLLDPDPQFGPSVQALQILSWAFPVFCANSLLYSALVTVDEEMYLAKLMGLAVLVNVGLNLFAIPALGINGAAIATIVPEVLLVAFYAVRYRRRSAAWTT